MCVVLLFKMFQPLIGSASIQYANDEDWDQRQKCLYKTLKGEDLKAYFPKFVTIAKVKKATTPYPCEELPFLCCCCLCV